MINIDEHKNFTSLLEKAIEQSESIFVMLDSGKEYYGKAAMFNDHYLVIKQISGKEYYDVMIRFDKITAIEVRNREN